MHVKAREENERLKRRAAELQIQANLWSATREQMKTKASDMKASLVNLCLCSEDHMFYHILHASLIVLSGCCITVT